MRTYSHLRRPYLCPYPKSLALLSSLSARMISSFLTPQEGREWGSHDECSHFYTPQPRLGTESWILSPAPPRPPKWCSFPWAVPVPLSPQWHWCFSSTWVPSLRHHSSPIALCQGKGFCLELNHHTNIAFNFHLLFSKLVLLLSLQFSCQRKERSNKNIHYLRCPM